MNSIPSGVVFVRSWISRQHKVLSDQQSKKQCTSTAYKKWGRCVCQKPANWMKCYYITSWLANKKAKLHLLCKRGEGLCPQSWIYPYGNFPILFSHIRDIVNIKLAFTKCDSDEFVWRLEFPRITWSRNSLFPRKVTETYNWEISQVL